jgi:hypothetical protein
MESQKMNSKTNQTILLMGKDTDLSYLLGRFAEQSEYQLAVAPEKMSIHEVMVANPMAIIFTSTDLLDNEQALLGELTSLELPIIVCTSVTDEAKARALGADSCLLHPITFDSFQNALALANATKRT